MSPDDSPISTSSEGSKSLKPEKKIMCLRARVAFLSKELEELTMSNLDYQQRLTTLRIPRRKRLRPLLQASWRTLIALKNWTKLLEIPGK